MIWSALLAIEGRDPDNPARVERAVVTQDQVERVLREFATHHLLITLRSGDAPAPSPQNEVTAWREAIDCARWGALERAYDAPVMGIWRSLHDHIADFARQVSNELELLIDTRALLVYWSPTPEARCELDARSAAPSDACPFAHADSLRRRLLEWKLQDPPRLGNEPGAPERCDEMPAHIFEANSKHLHETWERVTTSLCDQRDLRSLAPDSSNACSSGPDVRGTQAFRDRLVEVERFLTSADVARLWRTAVLDSNPSQYASRLRREGRLLAGKRGREFLHPPFQFVDTGGVHELIAALIAALPAADPGDGGWDRIFWCYQPHAALDDLSPAEAWAKDPARIIHLASTDHAGVSRADT